MAIDFRNPTWDQVMFPSLRITEYICLNWASYMLTASRHRPWIVKEADKNARAYADFTCRKCKAHTRYEISEYRAACEFAHHIIMETTVPDPVIYIRGFKCSKCRETTKYPNWLWQIEVKFDRPTFIERACEIGHDNTVDLINYLENRDEDWWSEHSLLIDWVIIEGMMARGQKITINKNKRMHEMFIRDVKINGPLRAYPFVDKKKKGAKT